MIKIIRAKNNSSSGKVLTTVVALLLFYSDALLLRWVVKQLASSRSKFYGFRRTTSTASFHRSLRWRAFDQRWNKPRFF